ncbi:hypothetical protein FIBSPDRAFT_872730, partial [Athelia psychrophila]
MPSGNRAGASSQLHRRSSSLRIPIHCQFPASPAESYASVDGQVPRLNFPHPPSVIHQSSANRSVNFKSQPFALGIPMLGRQG